MIGSILIRSLQTIFFCKHILLVFGPENPFLGGFQCFLLVFDPFLTFVLFDRFNFCLSKLCPSKDLFQCFK